LESKYVILQSSSWIQDKVLWLMTMTLVTLASAHVYCKVLNSPIWRSEFRSHMFEYYGIYLAKIICSLGMY